MSERRSALDQVYSAKTGDELESAYKSWAADYDRETLQMGYSLPFVVTSWVARHVPGNAAPLLDAGCGTGLSGPYLAALGYDEVEGLDMSDDMLAIAAARGGYSSLKKAALGGKLPWPDAYFAGFLSAGVFTEGHAPASGLDELVRITRPGGHGVFIVRDTLIEKAGFRAKFEELEAAGKWRPIEQSAPFRAFIIEEPEVFSIAFVFEIL